MITETLLTLFSFRGGVASKCKFMSLRSLIVAVTDREPKANPKLAQLKDDDGRLPIHWAVSYNHPEIVSLLISQRGFDPDAEVDILLGSLQNRI